MAESEKNEIIHVRPKKAEMEKEKTIHSKWGALLKEKGPEIKKVDVEKFEETFCLYNVFSKAECATLIEETEKAGYGKTHYPKDYRGNLRLMTYDDSLANVIFNRTKSFFPQTITNSKGTWKLQAMNDKLRCAKYFPGDQFNSHVDASFCRTSDCRSFFTVNIYINDEFKGGSTRFYETDEFDGPTHCVKPVTGMALIFRQPPGQNHLHDGEQVKSGFKYLLRSDAMYVRVDLSTPDADIDLYAH